MVTSSARARLKELERENRELHRAVQADDHVIQTAPGKLIEGHQTPRMARQALAALTVAYPDRITPHLN